MNLKIIYSVLTSCDYTGGALCGLRVFVQAASIHFPSMHEFSDYAPMHGSYIGMTEEDFLATELGASLASQAKAKLQQKWDQLLTATKEGAA